MPLARTATSRSARGHDSMSSCGPGLNYTLGLLIPELILPRLRFIAVILIIEHIAESDKLYLSQ